jgi:gliding motility-associated lipoprotein GldK
MRKSFSKISISIPTFIGIVLVCSVVFISASEGPFWKRMFKSPTKNAFDSDMTLVTSGSFYMGPSDEQIDNAMMNRKRLVSVNSFWMDKTEITNEQYRRFVRYVFDSLAYFAIKTGSIANPDDTTVDWNNEIFRRGIDLRKKATQERLSELALAPDNRMNGQFGIDNTKLIYKYSYVDLKSAARESKGLERALGQYIVTETEPVYPDSLVWMRDFSYSYNEPMTRLYFSSKAYDQYPVVGVTWKQAVAFCHWRTNNSNYYRGHKGRAEYKIDGIYRLPTEAEWEYAARGKNKTNAMYPWGSAYTRTVQGRLNANFKPGRGDYFGGNNSKDDNIYTTPVGKFHQNLTGFELYDMAGNVAEWTSSVYYEGSYNFIGDFSPDVQYNAKQNDPILMKRKVIRGGSWKDIAYNCQVSTRNYEYQDTAKSFIGFRCVLSSGPKTN